MSFDILFFLEDGIYFLSIFCYNEDGDFFMLYTSLENKKIKDIKKLNTKKYRDKTGLFLVEGEHLVLEAYKTGYIKELILEQDALLPLNVPTSYVTNDILHALTELETPSSMMAICEKKESEILGNRILMLDDIQDPGNLGTIIRSAVAFHIDTIVLGLGCVDLYNSKTIRASQGMLFHVNMIRKSLIECIEELKKEGYSIMGTKVTHGKNIKDIAKKEKSVIIMGNEGNGVKEDILDLCDEYLYIPCNGVCESLNVGVATSIILYELDK